MSPRPILKRSSCGGSHYSNIHPPELPIYHAVHFPPSPSLTHTFTAHSPLQYDRSPIQVTPNNCALPERGCPGRTYTLEEKDDASGSYFPPKSTIRGHPHPRALARQQNNATYGGLAVPPMIPDLSSSSSESSEESDGISSPIPPSLQRQPYYSSADRYPSHYSTTYDPISQSIQPSSIAQSGYSSQKYQQYPSYSQYPAPPVIEPVQPRPRRRTSRPRESSSRRSSPPGDEEDDPGYDDDADVATPTAPSYSSKRRERRPTGMASLCKSFSGFNCNDEDGGCLGGF